MSVLSDLAMTLAQSGLPVFPCLASKAPAIAGGFKSASTDAADIRAMFSRPGATLIGVPTGPASGLDALDIDPCHGGDQWWAEHVRKLPRTRVHKTRSGGLHALFRTSTRCRNSAGRIASGVDTRGLGGFVIWWPAADLPIHDVEVAAWPEWLLAKLDPECPAPTPTRFTIMPGDGAAERCAAKILRCLERACDGQKHITLRKSAFALGGLLEALGWSAAHAQGRLVEAVQAAGAIDLDNAQRTAAWGLKRGAAAPLDLGVRR